MSEEINNFDTYLEEHGFGEHRCVLNDYEEVIRERIKNKNVSPKTTLAGALYDAKKGEMTQQEVAKLAGTTEVSIRSARESMGLINDDNLDELRQVVPYPQASLLDDYAGDTIGEPPEAIAAILHSEVLGKPVEDAAEYFDVTEDEIERASSWLDENRDEEELTLESVRRHLDDVRREKQAFKQFLEK